MCFSATASFVAAGITGAIGLAALRRTQQPRQWPMAAVPLMFAFHQAVEGALWFWLPGDGDQAVTTALTYVYLSIAEVWWPLYIPLACLLIEPERMRRTIMLLCAGLGVGVATHFLVVILKHDPVAQIIGGHIVYVSEAPVSHLMGTAYLLATGVPLLLSSHRAMALMGGIVITGASLSYWLYWESFVSVWCFFGAAASVVIIAHFEWIHRRQLRSAPS